MFFVPKKITNIGEQVKNPGECIFGDSAIDRREEETACIEYPGCSLLILFVAFMYFSCITFSLHSINEETISERYSNSPRADQIGLRSIEGVVHSVGRRDVEPVKDDPQRR